MEWWSDIDNGKIKMCEESVKNSILIKMDGGIAVVGVGGGKFEIS